ncbi:MAG: flagellar basal body rod protein FlgG [Firmicutes bacterium HGW-Firmicutes-7]|nr:MAG: flagellar basal body rod protein FlgG [Firmicutes bacterium HGW-Firmicutes-7]
MLRSLWTAASGMKSQQLYVDSIAHNLANVNTVGYKKESMEFKSLLYETLRASGVDENGNGTPVSLQVGHGVRASANVKNFSQGSIETTNNPLDFSIDGDGFFVIQGLNEEQLYTKDGAFKLSIMEDGIRLTTSDGYAVLNSEGEPIEFDNTFMPDKLVISSQGEIGYMTEEGVEDLGTTVAVAQFRNVAGLDAVGGNFYKATGASGQAILEAEDDELKKSNIMQGTLESSNVQVVDEMVKMIIAQRAYELNSKAIQTSDDMLGMANNLKR